MDREKLLERAANGDERLVLARVLDKLKIARSRNIPACTDFLSPQQRAAAETVLRLAGVGEDGYAAFGGCEGAERQVLLLLPDWMEREQAEPPLRYLRASYRPEDRLSHRDLLGSLMGLGIAREKLGDLLAGEERCDVIALDSVADFLLQNWSSAGRAALHVAEVAQSDLCAPALRREEVRDTVTSPRLDAVAAAGFRLSRGKAAELVESGRVQVNYLECTKPDRLLRQGDTVSARGLGKFQLREMGGLTRKGRTGIVLERYL